MFSSGFRVALCVLCLVCAHVTVAKRGQKKVNHAGHPAEFVTRLHRFDHSGLGAMLESEARWRLLDATPSNASFGGSSLAEISAVSAFSSAERGFVKLSRKQVAGLRAHHKFHTSSASSASAASSLVQLGGTSEIVTSGFSLRHGHSSGVNVRQGEWRKDQDFEATHLSSLGSQYVGPIGVGTKVGPEGCVMPAEGGSLLFVQEGVEPQLEPQSGPHSNATSDGAACHAMTQVTQFAVLDTGSTNLWMASDLCKTGPCRKPGRVRFDHTDSSTFKEPEVPNKLNIEFGTGKLSGPQGIDNFHVGPFTVKDQTFAMIETQEGAVFDEVPFDGILGLAFPSMSSGGVMPFFDNVIQQKVLKKNEFAFYFSLDNPSANAIFWGGIDDSFHGGQIEYFKVTDPYYWSLDLLSFQIGGEELLGTGEDSEPSVQAASLLEGGASGGASRQRRERWGRTTSKGAPRAIVDTGTTFFTAESNIFQKVLSKLPEASCKTLTQASHPDILYRLVNSDNIKRDFVLNFNQYMAASDDGHNAWCTPSFMQIDIPQAHGPGMVLGEVFMRNYFSVYDRGDGTPEDARVGFAPSSHGVAQDKRLKQLTKDQLSFEAAHHANLADK